jgi:hypothetical protein
MAVLIENVFPIGATNEFLDAVTDEMDVDTKLPPGGILHVHFEKGGRFYGVDVFDSEEAYQQFVQSTLMPAMAKVAAARGIDIRNGRPRNDDHRGPSPRSLDENLADPSQGRHITGDAPISCQALLDANCGQNSDESLERGHALIRPRVHRSLSRTVGRRVTGKSASGATVVG